MNPFFQAIFGTIAALARTCANCGHRQLVPKSRRHEPVTCTRCGTTIPPPQDARRAEL